VFLAASVAQPLCLVVEDLHWIDVETQEVLDRLVTGVANARVLLLVNYRPEYQHPWGNKTYYSQLRLDALPAESAGELLDALLGEDPGLAPLKQLLIRRGNPFFLEETVRTLVETNALDGPRGRYRLTQPVQAIQVPPTVQAILAARIDRLAPEDRHLLQVASVVGKDVPFALLQAIAELPDEALRRGLESLQAAEFLYETGLYPDLAYSFKHALTHEVTYGTLLQDRRKALHARIVGAIERFYPERLSEGGETQPELLAHHYTEAGLPAQAIPYWQRAGQRALQRSAYAEAIAHLRRGLSVLAALPETPAHLRQELDLQVALGAALMATQGYASPDVEHTHARARELCQRLGDTPHLFQALRGLSLHYLARGLLDTASDLGLLLLRHAETQPDPAPRLLAHHQMGMVLGFRGEPAQARAHHSQGLALYRSQADHALAGSYGVDLGVLSHCWLAWELWLLGYPDQAVQEGVVARRLAQEAAHPWGQWMTLFWSAALHQWRRETPVVSELITAAMTLATEQRFTQWLAWGRLLQGWTLALQGQGEQGLAAIRQGLAAELAMGSRVWQPYGLGLLAEAHGHGGQPGEGLAALAEARAVLQVTEVRFYAAELYRLQGALLLRQAVPDAAQAEECFQQALDVARRQGAKSWELRVAMSLSRLWQQQGKRAEAYTLLAPIYGWFTEGFDTADLQEAKVLLERFRG
jgi:predicted ATPase